MTPDELLTHVLVDLAVDGVRLQPAMRQPKYRDNARELARQLLETLTGPPGPRVPRAPAPARGVDTRTPVSPGHPLDPETPLADVETRVLPRVPS